MKGSFSLPLQHPGLTLGSAVSLCLLGSQGDQMGAPVQVGEGFLYLRAVQGGTMGNADMWLAEALLSRG